MHANKEMQSKGKGKGTINNRSTSPYLAPLVY
jgi:hypothetical protein